ncbi:MAG: thioredoxin-disulfide reductase [Clostridiales bacterium]|nr:thioredoxin-disulfide reductase [Clostridiales bacterium]
MEQIYDAAVVGGGPGGYTAALYCVRAGLSTLILEGMAPGGQLATTSQVENYPGFDQGIDGFELAQRMRRGAERFGAEIRLDQAGGMELNKTVKCIRVEGGQIMARTVILAAGAAPRELGLPAEQRLRGRGVSYCATCDGSFYKGKTVAVVGGGNSAAEEALVLAKLCKKVYIVHRRETMRATKSYLSPLERADNISFLWNREIAGLQGEDRLTGLRLRDVQTGGISPLTVDGLFVAIGRIPNTELCRGMLDLDEAGYVLADETTRTSLPGVFAVGDMRTKPLRQIITAAADGAVAAKFAEEYLSGKTIS